MTTHHRTMNTTNEETTLLWDAQIEQDGQWVSIYGPFEDIDDAKDIVKAGIKKATQPTSFRIIPLVHTNTTAQLTNK